MWSAISLLLVALWGNLDSGPACPVSGAADPPVRPVLSLVTDQGPIHIELFEDAAPEAVSRLVAAARSAPSPGLYAGVTFGFVQPRVEIVAGIPPVLEGFLPENRFDGRSLGLDEWCVADRAEAMELVQRELLPELARRKEGGQTSRLLERWRDQWYETYQADFLIGVSRLEINQALGYDTDGAVASRPPVEGAVALRPASATRSTLELSILLTDLPERSGRWMVIGRVLHGLELARQISVRPLEFTGSPRSTRPRDPVTLRGSTLDCRPIPFHLAVGDD
jgi:cyclophilin family peptidyl-prolyl cis-trans isomerase